MPTEVIVAICAVAGIVITVIFYFITVSYKAGKIDQHLGTIGGDVKDIKKDLKEIPVIKFQVNELWGARVTSPGSPLELNEIGRKVLEDSKIREIIIKNYESILEEVKEAKPTNAYQAQQLIIDIVRNLRVKEECKELLEKSAFDSGSSISTILFVGAIDIRDKILQDLGFEVSDIDKYEPKSK